MPSIVEYDHVLARMRDLGLRCVYYNSGAFGFNSGIATSFVGWIGPEDPTIRPAARRNTRRVREPLVPTLASLATQAWLSLFPGPVWIMPKSQWAYELDFGSKAWLPDALNQAGVDVSRLAGRTDSPAVQFEPEEADRFTPVVESLLNNLAGSDFALAFAGWPVACTLHHHQQVWWISSDRQAIERLETLTRKIQD